MDLDCGGDSIYEMGVQVRNFIRLNRNAFVTVAILLLLAVGGTYGQLQQSGGVVTVNAKLQDGSGNLITSTGNALDVNIKSGVALTISGIVKQVPGACTQTTVANFSTIGVATGAGTAVTAVTSCIVKVYANNTTNLPVTLRLTDKQGSPVIWVGGNADFIIPSNSNISPPLEGVLFTSGIQAIAGTAAAINLNVETLQ